MDDGPVEVSELEAVTRYFAALANEYAEDALARTEEAVRAALEEVQQSRVRFRSASAAKMQEQREKLEGRAPEQEESN